MTHDANAPIHDANSSINVLVFDVSEVLTLNTKLSAEKIRQIIDELMRRSK